MRARILFVTVFTLLHAGATLGMAARFMFTPISGALWERLFQWIAGIMTLPILYPIMRADPDGELWWAGGLVVLWTLLNSSLWALALLLLRLGIRHKHARGAAAQPGS